MITLDDWSELITIDYNGGLSGEFFGHLLYDAIDKDNNVIFDPSACNKYNFSPYDVFSDIETPNRFRKIYYYRQKYLNVSVDSEDDCRMSFLYDKMFKDGHSFEFIFKKFIYERYKNKFDGNLKITLFHENILFNEMKSIADIFPKSKNIMLVCPEHYELISKFLMLIKIITHKIKLGQVDITKYTLINFLTYQHTYVDYRCLKIDMYSLLYEDKNYDKQISNLLKKDIILDKKIIEEYAQKNYDILKKYDIDIYNVYSRKYMLEKTREFLNFYMKEINCDNREGKKSV